MVGYAMNQSFKAMPPVPAHRVLNRNGMLTGKMHFETPDTMQLLLEDEGIRVVADQVQDHEDIFWDPNDHLQYAQLFGDT
jgi:methylated-DNA-protein-cysteine methyltransferase-like protein